MIGRIGVLNPIHFLGRKNRSRFEHYSITGPEERIQLIFFFKTPLKSKDKVLKSVKNRKDREGFELDLTVKFCRGRFEH